MKFWLRLFAGLLPVVALRGSRLPQLQLLMLDFSEA